MYIPARLAWLLTKAHSCGWGSASLYFAEKLPNAKITGFSNSRTQKEHIDGEAKRKGLKNLQIITGDVVDYEFEPEQFDRVVSIEVRATMVPFHTICGGTNSHAAV